MTLRPAPGQQLSSGRLRVDATKAIAKLREYQLVDRTAWILEAIRAAVASGATQIDLQGDSNDVWLSWSGEPWAAEDLPRLFDELVSPEPGAARYHVRLLAAAVNSALGAHPAYVDVYAVGDASAIRTRYTPDVLEAPTGELAESPLRNVRAEDAGIPHGAPKGMHVHFRRRASLEVVSYWLRRADPPELAMARSACADIPVPIRIGESVFDRAAGHGDVVRVPLGDDLDGWIAITDTRLAPPHAREVTLAIAERGVLLETTSIDVGLPPLVAPIPLRVFVDAPRMPTNASRSEVRRDAHPIPAAARRAKELVPALIEKLVERCRGVAVDPRARHAALHLLGAVMFGPDWAARAREVPPPLRALAELPLVRDAAGVPRPVAWAWSGLVHAGAKPLPEELAPWLSHVLWAPSGDPSAAITTWYLDALGLHEHLGRAKRERRAERKFYKHAPRAPQVLGRRKPRVRARLGAPLAGSCVPDELFANLAGEVCVYRDRPAGELIVMLGGRELETIEFDSAIPFAAVIDSDRVTPTNRYRGVARDAMYTHVERAMRAGIVRALEAVALAHRERFVDGYQVATEGNEVVDAPLIRQALRLARNLEAPLGDVLANARIWRTTDGLRSIAELREHRVLGVVPAHANVPPLAGRVVVYADDADLALLVELTHARFIAYEPGALAARIEPDELAEQITGSSPHALAFTEWDLVAAIAPADKPQLRLCHRGRPLADWTYTPTLAPCAIAVDCDALVPGDDYGRIDDDAGLGTRDYAPWERRLARAAAAALLGEHPPGLLGTARAVELGGTLGRWLCFSLVHHADPASVLGEDLLARLRLAALFRVLGDPHAYSIDELAVMFPDTIRFVDHPTDPVDGFPVVVAETIVARLLAKLAGRKFRNAADELAQRRQQLARELRLGMHRAKPVQPIEVAGTHVTLRTGLGHGVVGVGRDTLELQVLFEGRLFQTITRAHEPPLACVFELDDIARTDAAFERLAPGVEDTLVADVRGRCPDLLRAIAAEFPEAFADAGPRRALLARHAAKHTLAVDVRETLARTIRFETIQGRRATFLDARSGPAIQVSTWHGEWLGADGDDHVLDRPVLRAGAPELDTIWNALGNIVDVTPDVERLQAQRRMARGLLPTPKVSGADPAFARGLSALGPAFRRLGPGEVALVGGVSEVVLHVHGEPRDRVPIDCEPAIQLAIEAPELVGDRTGRVEQRLGDDARELAVQLVRRLLLERPADTFPADIRRALRRAILAGRLPDLRTAPVFETATGAWIDLAAVQAQRELFGNLWCVASVPPDATPLDERRLVLVLSNGEQALANAHGIPVVEATGELALDAKTRRNRARPPATSLAVDEPGVLARVELDGDGVTAPRGTVAILAPDAADRRQLRLHRAMHPFDAANDPCRWPTIAAIDDARFTPDRCWEQPERDDIYRAAIELLHRASNDALRALAPPPATALASIRVAPWTYDAIAPLRNVDIQLRGTLWLDGPPLTTPAPAIRVVEKFGESAFVPLRGINVAGTIFVHAPNGWPRDAVLEAVVRALHGKLVRELALARRRDPDLVAAHVAYALALERITPDDARYVRFACFRPGPIDAAQLATILAATAPVTKIGPTDTEYAGAAFVADGTHTARVIESWLGARLLAPIPSPRRRPDTVEPAPRPVVDHPLQPFVDRLHARIGALGVQVPQWRIVDDRDDPIAHHDGAVLELAAGNRHIVSTAAALAASTPWSADALDAIAAHCITVLNVALTSITDATEARAIGKLLG